MTGGGLHSPWIAATALHHISLSWGWFLVWSTKAGGPGGTSGLHLHIICSDWFYVSPIILKILILCQTHHLKFLILCQTSFFFILDQTVGNPVRKPKNLKKKPDEQSSRPPRLKVDYLPSSHSLSLNIMGNEFSNIDSGVVGEFHLLTKQVNPVFTSWRISCEDRSHNPVRHSPIHYTICSGYAYGRARICVYVNHLFAIV